MADPVNDPDTSNQAPFEKVITKLFLAVSQRRERKKTKRVWWEIGIEVDGSISSFLITKGKLT